MNTIRKHLNTIAVSHKYIKKSGDVMTKKGRLEGSSKNKEGILEQLNSCLVCKGKLVVGIEINVIDGKSFPMTVKKCSKCGEIFVDPKETDRIITLAHPSMLDRIKKLFSVPKEERISVFEGKVL